MNLKASVNYHIVSPLAQAFHFDVDGILGQLISPELVTTDIDVEDIRDAKQQPNFVLDGILFTEHTTKVSNFSDQADWQATYEAEIQQLLHDTVGAKEVIVFDHTVRKDLKDAERKPARNVHNDYSEKGAKERLQDLVGTEKARQIEAGHYGFVNLWRPIENPVFESPLGFIKPASMQSQDWMNIELVYPDRKGQILGVANNPSHEWFYRSHMTPDEIIVFNVFDNQGRPHLAHSALDITDQDASAPPRQSIESRMLVIY
ncbi:CmcJ/NvfI family oxidoreductase [Marinomonas epiphytica]